MRDKRWTSGSIVEQLKTIPVSISFSSMPLCSGAPYESSLAVLRLLPQSDWEGRIVRQLQQSRCEDFNTA